MKNKQTVGGNKSNPSPKCFTSYLFQVHGCENLLVSAVNPSTTILDGSELANAAGSTEIGEMTQYHLNHRLGEDRPQYI